MRKTVVIDCFPESVKTYRNSHVIVAVDVIRATTTVVTGVARGRSWLGSLTGSSHPASR